MPQLIRDAGSQRYEVTSFKCSLNLIFFFIMILKECGVELLIDYVTMFGGFEIHVAIFE